MTQQQIDAAVAEAREHGHPQWSHAVAYGPCVKPTRFSPFVRRALAHTLTPVSRLPVMMPGQEPYTERQLAALYSLVTDAADADPGEEGESR